LMFTTVQWSCWDKEIPNNFLGDDNESCNKQKCQQYIKTTKYSWSIIWSWNL